MSLKRPITDPSASTSSPPNKKPSTTPREVPRILIAHDKERRRTFFWTVTPEQELELRLSSTRNFDDVGMPFKPPAADVYQSVLKMVGEMEPGGYLSADWDTSEEKEEKADGHGKVEEQEEDEYGYEDLRLAQEYQDIDDSLCEECSKVVTESEILNRPWRTTLSSGEVEEGVPLKAAHEEPIPWTKKKVNIFAHHRELGALRRSALAGCHFCSLIDAEDPSVPFRYDEKTTWPYTLKVIFGKNHNEGPGVIVLEPKGAPTRAIKLMYGKPGYRVTSTLHQQRTNAKEVLGLARKWLDTCLNEHEACRARASSSKNFIPTRLIEITPINESIMSLRLVHGQDLPPETQYLTLSHCWGRAKFTTLTPDTLAPFQKEIPFFQLPKNFRDATTATSLLGYKHIWIDSLCIIQGCEEDWEQEAARMGSVYRHSVCTIAALGSDNGHGGCFMTRSHKAFVPCQLVPQSKEKSGVYADLWRPTNSLQPLHDRAWVVQERCLSIRTLNFGKEMVSWDCICAKASELEPDMQDTSYEGGLKRTFNDLLSKSKSTPPAASDQRRWSDKWWKLVSAYSSCNLTYAKDKWPAISGLATEVENDGHRKLYHGLWTHNLADELLWTVTHPRAKRLGIEMPSWSWMSVEGCVNQQRYDYEKDFRLDAVAYPVPPSEATPAIHVTARMLKLKFIDRPRPKLKHYEDESFTHKFRLLGLVADRGGSGLPLWDGEWLPDTTPDLKWETWALQIVESDAVPFKQRAGLVVIPVSGKKDTWRRVGYYGFGWRDKGRGGVERFFGERRSVTLV